MILNGFNSKITEEEYILAILKDDLASGKKPELLKVKEIIENSDLFNLKENQIRKYILAISNGAIGSQLYNENIIYYQKDIDNDSFLNLKWCPHNGSVSDIIGVITQNTRQISAIISFFKNNSLENLTLTQQKELKELFFLGKIKDIAKSKRRLFLFEKGNSLEILDGNHRAACMINTLICQEEFETIKGYFAKFP